MKLLRKKRFWIAIIFVLIFSIIFDLVVLNIWAVNSIRSGHWDIRLLLVAAGIIVGDGFGSVYKQWKKRIALYTRFVFFVLIVLAISIHGLRDGLIFMSLALILSRLVRILIWVIKKGVNKFNKRGLLEEI